MQDSDSYYAGQELKTLPKLSFKVRTEDSDLPRYLGDLGVEMYIKELDYWTDLAKSQSLENLDRYAEAAHIYERIGSTSSPQFAGYASWMKRAADTYTKAGRLSDAKRIHDLLAKVGEGAATNAIQFFDQGAF